MSEKTLVSRRRMKFTLLSLSALLATASATANVGKSFAPNSYYHVECETATPSKCALHEGKEAKDGRVSHAYGLFDDTISTEGWGKLWVHGDESTQGYYEAGFLVSVSGKSLEEEPSPASRKFATCELLLLGS